MASRKATSYQVARASGVSQATVSYVLNDTPGQKISEETRRRVLAAAEELGYRPYGPARTLKRGRSSNVLFVLSDSPGSHALNRFFGQLAAALGTRGYGLLLCRLADGESVLALADDLAPAAIISASPLSAEEAAILDRRGVPVEVIGLALTDVDATVPVPQERIGELQAGLMLRLGHRRLVYAQPRDDRLRKYSVPRLHGARGVVSSVEGASLEVVELGDDRDECIRAVRTWREAGVTAVCAYNDEVALAILGAATVEHIGVPADLAVVGVDDIPLAKHAVPPLSSVRLDMEGSAELIVARILGDVPASFPDEPQLILREST